MQSINGYSYGQLTITSTGDVPGTTTINLPLTNRGGGLEENTVLRQIRQENIGLDTASPTITQLQEALGFDLIWTFHYEDWITGDDLFTKFYPILKAWKAGHLMMLKPRIDVDRSFQVILINETLTLKLNKATQKNKYHKGALFTFQTVETQSDPNWILTPQEGDPVIIVAINEFNYNA